MDVIKVVTDTKKMGNELNKKVTKCNERIDNDM